MIVHRDAQDKGGIRLEKYWGRLTSWRATLWMWKWGAGRGELSWGESSIREKVGGWPEEWQSASVSVIEETDQRRRGWRFWPWGWHWGQKGARAHSRMILRSLGMMVMGARRNRGKRSKFRVRNSLRLQVTCSTLRCVQKAVRRPWNPPPVLLPGKSHGRKSLVGCSPWGR